VSRAPGIVRPTTMASAGTYRALMCEKISKSAVEGIEAAVIRDLPRQAQLKDDEVRISVRAASLNFPELLMMQNKYQYKPKLPFVLCTEGAGVVTEVGPKVTKFRAGDRVFPKWDPRSRNFAPETGSSMPL